MCKVGTGGDRTTSGQIARPSKWSQAKLTKAIKKANATWLGPKFFAGIEYRIITSECTPNFLSDSRRERGDLECVFPGVGEGKCARHWLSWTTPNGISCSTWLILAPAGLVVSILHAIGDLFCA